jgi:hypothetical protein
MATSNGTFTLTINTNAGFGETNHPHIERQVLNDLLHQVAQDVGSGRPSRPIIDRNGNNVGSYTYGTGMSNAGA